MTKLRLSNGDDHPDSAHRHLLDAGALLARQRPDGAAYLSGYVVECSLKSIHVLETGKALKGHNFRSLIQNVSAAATAAGAKTAKYLGRATIGLGSSDIASWDPEMRYRSSFMTVNKAKSWHACAEKVYTETVHQMQLDGVI
jgi:HEPN domain-containing protein